jgi:nucleoside-diphosphate-sugar epimerase
MKSGAGKLGRAVVADLSQAGHEIVVYDRAAFPGTRSVRYLVGDIEQFKIL